MSKAGFVYIASPYSHMSKMVMKGRFKIVEYYTALCLKQKEFVYSPIVHCHQIALDYTLPPDFDFWREYNFAMLGKAKEMRILELPQWRESKGVTFEERFCFDNSIKVVNVSWADICSTIDCSGRQILVEYIACLEAAARGDY